MLNAGEHGFAAALFFFIFLQARAGGGAGAGTLRHTPMHPHTQAHNGGL